MADPVLTPEQIAEQEAFAKRFGVKPAKVAPATAPTPVPPKESIAAKVLREREQKAGLQ